MCNAQGFNAGYQFDATQKALNTFLWCYMVELIHWTIQQSQGSQISDSLFPNLQTQDGL